MKPRFRCLVLDHDDTVVNSTATVHYPSFVRYMEEFHGGTEIDLRTYFEKNFDPGVIPFFREIVGLSEEEMLFEQEYWNRYVQSHVPQAYPGIRQILEKQRSLGGLITVISHSFGANILRDWRENDLPQPDAVYGWELPGELRKPHPYALKEIMSTYHLRPEDLVVIDDLKPGYDMARAAGVSFAAAGWANDITMIEDFMRRHSDRYFKTVAELAEWLFLP